MRLSPSYPDVPALFTQRTHSRGGAQGEKMKAGSSATGSLPIIRENEWRKTVYKTKTINPNPNPDPKPCRPNPSSASISGSPFVSYTARANRSLE